jgi:hypothetical protein
VGLELYRGYAAGFGDSVCFPSRGLRVLSAMWFACLDGFALSRLWVLTGGSSLDARSGPGGCGFERASGLWSWSICWRFGGALGWMEGGHRFQWSWRPMVVSGLCCGGDFRRFEEFAVGTL